MKLLRLGRRTYKTADDRFHVAWSKNQGARSCYRVQDRKTDTSLRAFTLEEVHATIRDMLANDRYQKPTPTRVRIPNEGEKIEHRSPANTEVFLTIREVKARAMGSRMDPRIEAELRELIGDAYVTVGRVARTTREEALKAAHELAKRRGWQVNARRLGWATRDAAYERAVAEMAQDYVPGAKEKAELAERVERMQYAAAHAKSGLVADYVAATGYAFGKRGKEPGRGPSPLLFTEFITEMHEILRDARKTQATDVQGRNIELYYGDMMKRLEGAVDLVNARIAQR